MATICLILTHDLITYNIIIMPTRSKIAKQAALGLEHFKDLASKRPVLIGFDGFVDSIIQLVDKRQDAEHYQPVKTIKQFGEKILQAAGQSANYELVTLQRKLGGNGPIMAESLACLGLPVIYVGAVGYPDLHAVFQPLAEHAEVCGIAEPGFTDALEFADGKLMLGKIDKFSDVNPEEIEITLGLDTFNAYVARAYLVGMVNWTMLTRMNDIWRMMIDSVLPEVGVNVGHKRRLIFIDMADPEKRTNQDIDQALQLCSELNEHTDVILGMNLKEANQISQILDIKTEPKPDQAIEAIAKAIRQRIDLHCVVIHPRHQAAAAIRDHEGHIQSATFNGPYTVNPTLSTGAGDNFNAGFCIALLANMPLEESLCIATATSGYYVRNGNSPDLDQLTEFIKHMPEPEK